MNTPDPIDREATLALIESMLCGEIVPADAERLKELLHNSEAARLMYVEHIDLHAEMLRLAGRNESRDIEWLLLRPVGGRRLRLAAWALATTLAVLLVVVPGVWFAVEAQRRWATEQEFAKNIAEAGSSRETGTPPVVARLVDVVDAEWGEAMAAARLPVGTRWQAGEWIEVTSGTAILDFECGVRCLIRGETLLKLDALRTCTVDSGLATFEVSSQAIGFTVTTHGGSFVDLGTEFGVAVAEEGESEVHVFKGLVDAQMTSEEDPRPQKLRLTARKSARLDPFAGSLSPVAFAPERFAVPLSVAAGVKGFSDHVRFISQPIDSVVPAQLTGDDVVYLCREKSSVKLPAGLVVRGGWDFDVAGDPSPGRILPAGTSVNSFLLHGWPGEPRLVEGTITFRTPIAGVFVDKDLHESDALFARAETSLEAGDLTGRGLEDPITDETRLDRVRLEGPDRRTLSFRFNGGDVDQVRILTYAEAPR